MVDKKLTELDAITPTTDDIVYVVDDPGASPVSKKSTIANLLSTVNSTATAAYASRPAASKAGNIFLPNDGFVIERDTGAAWTPWGPIFPLTSPVLGDFAWINQGGATAVNTYGGIYLVGPAGAALNWRILKKSAPGTPYILTTLFLHKIAPADYIAAGICFRESATSKLAIIRFMHLADYTFNVTYYTNETTYSSDPATYTPGGFPPQLIWFQLDADGTNLVYRYSWDGKNFIDLLSTLKAAFFTTAPDEIGLCVQPQNASYTSEMILLHWKVT